MANKPKTVVLGTFDGVHPGHRALLDAARAFGGEVLVYTFARSPKGAKLLTLPPDREALLRLGGADGVYFEDFTSVRGLSPEAFVSDVLIGKLGAEKVVCGFNYRFGEGAKGDAEMLERLLAPYGVQVRRVEAVLDEGGVISSTRIRTLLSEGRMEDAAKVMGRRFFYHLPIVHGRKLGRKLGFPTANMRVPTEMITLPRGVYATVCEIAGNRYGGVTNVGFRPTVNEDEDDVTVETHLLSYAGDLYGKDMKVSFCAYLRGELRFDGAAALADQIEKDKETALRLLKGEGICD